MNRKNVGQNLRTLRKQCNITQAELAEKTGVTTDHISHAEIGSGSISIPLLVKICKILNVTPNDILAGEYSNESDDKFAEAGLYDKTISFNDVNPDDGILLNYMYQFMTTRKK